MCPPFSFMCHLERNEVESRDLRTFETFYVKSVRRSLDSLRSLGMTFSLRQQKEGTRPSPTYKSKKGHPKWGALKYLGISP